MSKRFFTAGFSVLFAVSAFAACGDDTESTVDCATVTPKGYSELSVAFGKCTSCHNSSLTDLVSRANAPLEYNYDTYEEAKKFPEKLLGTLEEGATYPMPPATDVQLTATEKADLQAWAGCDTPE